MTRKTWIRIGIVMVAAFMLCFSDWSFAADNNVGEIGSIASLLSFIVSVLSRIWVLFARLAGDFLTNAWVYGEKLGIDVLLWQYRNIVKNMANFCLGFYLVYVIFKGLIGQFGEKGDIMKNLKSVLLRVLVAGVGIQASRFLTSVVIDLGTITLSAVGAFPAQIVSKNENVKESFKISMQSFFGDDGSSIAFGKIYELFPKDGSANSFTRTTKLSLNTSMSEEKFFDNLMPNETDVAGPLYYLGFSILKVNEINSVSSWNSDSSLKKSILNLIIQGGTTIVYSIEMGILCIIALMRILYLWMFIVLSPLAILLACVGKTAEKDLLKEGFVGDLMKQINLKTFLAKVFQPAIIVLGISLCTIFVTLINGVVNKDLTRNMQNFDMGGGVTITTKEDPKNSNSDDVTYTTKFEGNLLEFSASHLGKGILDFMLSILTVILVYLIIKASIKIGNKIGGGQDFISKKIDNIQKGVEGVMTSIPIVPVAGYDKEGVPTTKYINAGQVFGLGGKTSLINEGIRRVQGKIADRYTEQNQVIDQWFGNEGGSLTSEIIRKIESAGSSMSTGIAVLTEKKKEIVSIQDENGKGMMLDRDVAKNDRFWIKEFGKWLTSMNGYKVTGTTDDQAWDDIIKAWNDSQTKDIEKKMEEIFNNHMDRVKAYAHFFFDQDDDRYNITTWDRLKNADISQKKESKQS